MFKTTVKIDGMACSMCEAHINDAIRKAFPGAKKVSSSHGRGEASFVTETAVEEQEIRRAIQATGYTFLSSQCVPWEKKGLFGR